MEPHSNVSAIMHIMGICRRAEIQVDSSVGGRRNLEFVWLMYTTSGINYYINKVVIQSELRTVYVL